MNNNTNIKKLGLKENWAPFSILVLITAFIGGMVGIERTILPRFAESQFGITSTTAILSFIIAFGIFKAISNYYAGRFANSVGRKNLLVIGWLIAIPIPFVMIYAQSWSWIIMANILLGISQGLTWSSTVVMKIDLVGQKNRGLAMGLNEFAGYLAVGIFAYLSGYIADHYGLTPYPFYLGIVISIFGLFLSIFFAKDTLDHAKKESETSNINPLENIFLDTTFKHKSLSAITLAGMTNNLNDGMIWGLLPILLLSHQLDTNSIAIIVATYPMVWGISQLFTGKMSDIYNKKSMLIWGMFLQGIVIFTLPFTSNFVGLLLSSISLGLGTALVYPTFFAAIADYTHPIQRAESIGVFRFWRDLGYAIGAILSGIVADLFGIEYAILMVGSITVLSSIVLKFRMENTIKNK